MLQYQLFKPRKKGFILTRSPFILEKNGELYVEFINAPANGTAIFEDEQKRTLYRHLKDGACIIPATFLTGTISVCVTVFDVNSYTYYCEAIYAKDFDSKIIVCPNGVDVPMELADLHAQLQEVFEENKTLKKQLQELNTKLDKILDGYDFD